MKSSIEETRKGKGKELLDKRIESKMKCKFLILFIVAALTAFCNPSSVSSSSIMGSAENFAVLGGTAHVTNTGATTITGDVGI